jgi:post-segregation antitoxin (ccd killing protein)
MAEYVSARLMVKRELWRRLKAHAALRGVSVSALAGTALEEWLQGAIKDGGR